MPSRDDWSSAIRNLTATFLVLVALASIYGVVRTLSVLGDTRQATAPTSPDALYAPLAPHIQSAPVVGFITDRLDVSGNRRLFSAQFALTPTVVLHEPDAMNAVKKLIDGYTIIADFRNAELLEDRISAALGLLQKDGITPEIIRFNPHLALIRTGAR